MKLCQVALMIALFLAPKSSAARKDSQPPLTVQVAANGKTMILDGRHLVATVVPQVFTAGWQLATYEDRPGQKHFGAFARLPGGVEVGLTYAVKIEGQKIRFRYVMTPLGEVTAQNLRTVVLLPYKDWMGTPFRTSARSVAIPLDPPADSMLGAPTRMPLSIGVGPAGAAPMVRMESSNLYTTVLDNRRWSPELAVEESFNEPRNKPWTWKAGETKVHAFTLSFGRRLVRRMPLPVKDVDALKPAVDVVAEPFIRSGLTAGMAVGVLYQGQTRVWGYGNVDRKGGPVPDGDTEFEAASITKLFTKLMLADRVRRGEVKFDDEAGAVLPREVRMPSQGGQPITLARLALHEAGLPLHPDNLDVSDRNYFGSYSVKDLYQYLSSVQKSTSPPGLYSNIGVQLLAHILCLKTGKTYEQYLRELVLDPVGMKDSGIVWTPEQAARAAVSYDPDHTALPRVDWRFPTLTGAMGLHTTVNDMLKLARALVDETSSPLSAVAFDEYAEKMTWGRRIVHLGWVNGFSSSFYVDRDARQAVVVWVNDGVNGPTTGLLIRLLLEGYATWDHDLSDLTDVTDAPIPDADKLAGTYVNREIPTGGAATTEVVVKVKDGKLVAHAIGRSELFDFRIYAKRDGTLFAKGPLYSAGGSEIVTSRNDKGEITGFSFRSGRFRVERKNQPCPQPERSQDGSPVGPSLPTSRLQQERDQ
jgi:CubicO group peptidase (beta-lactamase class C family)